MILVTGGAGFIGSNLVAALDDRGEEIAVCDWLGNDQKWRNLQKRSLAAVVRPPELPRWLRRHRQRVTAIFHLGAISATTETDGDLTVETNFTLSLKLWDWCSRWEVPLYYASSAATYGDGSQGFSDNESADALAALRPLNLYGWSKHLFDRRVMRMLHSGQPAPPAWAGLKFFNVYGPNEYHKGSMQSVVATLHRKLTAGDPPQLFKSYRADYADGGQLRDFVSVHDCVAVMLWLYDQRNVTGLFNVGTGQSRSFVDLARATLSAMGLKREIEFIEMPVSLRDRYQYFTQAEMQKLRSAGYSRPATSLEDGVTDYVTNYLMQADPYR